MDRGRQMGQEPQDWRNNSEIGDVLDACCPPLQKKETRARFSIGPLGNGWCPDKPLLPLDLMGALPHHLRPDGFTTAPSPGKHLSACGGTDIQFSLKGIRQILCPLSHFSLIVTSCQLKDNIIIRRLTLIITHLYSDFSQFSIVLIHEAWVCGWMGGASLLYLRACEPHPKW